MRSIPYLRLSALGALLGVFLLILNVAHIENPVGAQTTCTTCTNPPQLGRQIHGRKTRW